MATPMAKIPASTCTLAGANSISPDRNRSRCPASAVSLPMGDEIHPVADDRQSQHPGAAPVAPVHPMHAPEQNRPATGGEQTVADGVVAIVQWTNLPVARRDGRARARLP